MQSEQESGRKQLQEGRWGQDEHLRFLEGIMKYGKDWKIIQSVVKSRKGSQVRSHAQKFFKKLIMIGKERKKGKNQKFLTSLDIENQILNNFSDKDITKESPSELVELIRKDWGQVSLNFQLKRKRKFNKGGQKRGSSEKTQKQIKNKKAVQNNLTKINYLEEDQNEGSFFMKIIKMNKQHFRSGYDFLNLIDFGGVNHDDTQTAHGHEQKHSFCLLDEQLNPIKLKSALGSLHNGPLNSN